MKPPSHREPGRQPTHVVEPRHFCGAVKPGQAGWGRSGWKVRATALLAGLSFAVGGGAEAATVVTKTTTPLPTAAPAGRGFAGLAERDVHTWTLGNGLEVLFLAKHDAPVATVQIFYHVGSKDEHVGNRGVAHMFEHMMFKGSLHVPPEGHARMLKEVGGQVNAFTTEDVTVFHQTVPPSYVDFALELEA